MAKDKEKKSKVVKQKDRESKPAKAANDTPQEQRGAQSGIWQDERFQHLVTDPRFKQLPKSQKKVKIDKRFQSMFTDKKFNVKYTVDKYGRRVNASAADDLRKYYELDSSESDDDDKAEEAEKRAEEQAISRQTDDSDDASSAPGDNEDPGENDALDSEGEDEPKTLRERLLDPDIDYARGQGRLVTDSSTGEETSEEEEDPVLQLDHVWGELDHEAETTDESTRRLAVCNMDWDRIRATDLMVLFSSFLPPGGAVLSVKIYQSEYGKQRLAEEEKSGPQELVERSKANGKAADSDLDSDDSELVREQDSDAEEGDAYHMEKLRQYQLNRLRYYYAVVECDSVNTADKIYQECDGNEYESSATKIDLRFIPDDTTFDEDEPTDVCTELPEINSYQPRQFVNTALQQAKVDLTWDETAVERVELSEKLLNGKLENLNDADIRKIVAYSSEEDEDGDDEAEPDEVEARKKQPSKADEAVETPKDPKPGKKKKDDAIAKYKALLAEINEKEAKEKEKKYELTVSWDIEGKYSEEEDEKQKPKAELTPIEKVLQKRSEKNKLRKEMRRKKKREARGLDPDDSVSDTDSVPDDVDMNDPYFAEEFANGDFAPSKSKKQDKTKKQKKNLLESDEEEKRKERELQLLLSDDDLAEKGKQHFSLNKIMDAENETKSKRKRRKQLKKSKVAIAAERKEPEDNFQLNLNDDRFGAVYTSHHFNIDPTDAHFKPTKAMEQLINEKLKRRHGDGSAEGQKSTQPAIEDTQAAKRPKQKIENNLLVKSLKRKIQMQRN